jgi:hypothetical protein
MGYIRCDIGLLSGRLLACTVAIKGWMDMPLWMDESRFVVWSLRFSKRAQIKGVVHVKQEQRNTTTHTHTQKSGIQVVVWVLGELSNNWHFVQKKMALCVPH